ncbi:hypothetical protein BT63DRAFT_423501 [Microthyrium microscopicum]|uniref:Secreted protein n=1 Tax=Microthyrium microscopicum TaxID=703497 RepID=A0A6A6UIA5_9PEZI|nr:hypothetical protein BT63DRAFT_423501 [Microthyrium microscopicum]
MLRQHSIFWFSFRPVSLLVRLLLWPVLGTLIPRNQHKEHKACASNAVDMERQEMLIDTKFLSTQHNSNRNSEIKQRKIDGAVHWRHAFLQPWTALQQQV